MSVLDLFSLSGKVALVTGGSRGLGLEIAIALGEAGASVAVTARRDSWLKTAEQELKDRKIKCLATTCNVADPDQVKTAIALVSGRFGSIDVLVNNAGISWGAPADQMPVEKFREVFDTNVTGCFLMSQAVAHEMMPHGGGVIVNVASVTGLIGIAPEILDAVGYAASKGAVVSLTRDLAVKWARYGIRVNGIAPGFFRTRLTAGVIERSASQIEAATPMGRIGEPREIGGVVLFLASEASSYITGQVIPVDGGMTAA